MKHFDGTQVNEYRFANEIDKCLFKSGPIDFFFGIKPTSSGGKYFEKIEHADIVFLMYNFLATSKDGDDLSIVVLLELDSLKLNLYQLTAMVRDNLIEYKIKYFKKIKFLRLSQ